MTTETLNPETETQPRVHFRLKSIEPAPHGGTDLTFSGVCKKFHLSGEEALHRFKPGDSVPFSIRIDPDNEW